MRIGITFDLKSDGPVDPNLPDDLQEEFDSAATIESLAAALRGIGHKVEKLGDGRELLERLLADPPDLVFNFAEGQGVSRSREARVPAVCEMLGIPYTGSDPLTMAVTLDKHCANRLVQSAGVPVPPGVLVRPDSILPEDELADLAFPVIVKPNWEGSSKGIRKHCLVENIDKLFDVIRAVGRDHRQPLLVEEFIAGDEVTVGMLGNDRPSILGVMRVQPNEATSRFVYSLEIKRDFRRLVRYECPAQLADGGLEAVEEAALLAWEVLGCRDVARIDFRFRDGVPYFLEVNPLPGLNPESSDLVIMAGLCGWSYEKLIETILSSTLARLSNKNDARIRSLIA